jgi:hypothetical protein
MVTSNDNLINQIDHIEIAIVLDERLQESDNLSETT